MLEEEMRVGPKGQVVIPRPLRKVLNIQPGSKIIFKLEGERLILKKASFDTVGVLESIAKKGPSMSKISPHTYEEELSMRNV
ncbi:MAG: AbrB/MazE/SpoVT family DNA-binding domain-containing protein [Nitrososphaerales archaeon]|nr:AbrB/MazE/SpoVT family DNA-binding domain-containing protein [Nitrososphaerales archaeon]